ncbi:disease resistance protein RGA4-like [Triticum aestivum]|nr:disease resistance protein RGA4-like [Triticum aestivum]
MVSPAGLVAEKAAATAFANVVMGRLNRELGKKYDMWKNIKTEISSLQTDLGILAAAVDDHQSMAAPPRTAVARVYGEEIRELTHDIEDCVERFLHRVTCKPGTSRARRSAHAIRTFRTRLRFAAKIKEFRNRVAEARNRALNAAMLPDGAQASNNETMHQSAGFVQDCCHPVGIAEATMELRRLLNIEPNEDEAEGTSNNTLAAPQLRVVAIVGFGGSGKTTLAKAVYDTVHNEGSLHCVWVDGHSLDNKDANGIVKHIQEKLQLGEGSSTTSPTEYHKDR